MSLPVILTATLIWTLLVVSLKLLDHNLNGFIARQLDSRSITLKLFLFRYQTASIPPCLTSFTRRHRDGLRRFYGVGTLVVVCFVPVICLSLVGNVVFTISAMKESNAPQVSPNFSKDMTSIPNQSFRVVLSNQSNRFQKQTFTHSRRILHLKPRTEAAKPSTTKLTFFPHLPSLTFQRSDISLIFIALLVSVGIHEMGHLLCALTYQTQVSSIGVFVAFLFPGAFVAVSNLKQHPIWHQLQIVCAGIWHNLVVIVITIFTITLIPILSLPLYTHGGAVIITSLPPKSALSPSVSVGDIITAVADTNMTNGVSSFESVLSRLHGDSSSGPPGFCLPEKLFRQKDAACCRAAQWKAFQPTHTTRCFTTDSRAACLDAVKAALQPTCETHQDCKFNRRCVRPKLYQNDRLIVLTVKRKKHDVVRVLFDGSVLQLWRSVVVSNYVPRAWHWMNSWFVQIVACVDFPVLMVRLLWFIAGVCVVLAGSNMAPGMFLDGQLFAGLVILVIGKQLRWKQRVVKRLETVIVWSTTVMVVTNVLLSIWFMAT
eukprot:gb/GEZJ01001511.1/.p1 GENE.gb/GEZJ01001511.1/~~gb/GEZJ01001511.1/.p1  ORF type:complete len:543 (+),score=30.46 gb/GEZJ01001511.1/:1578-3206(+)